MSSLEPAFVAKRFESCVGIHVKITTVRPHIASDKTRRVKRIRISIFDGSDVGFLDAQFALNVQQLLADRRPLPPHNIAQAQFKRVKAFRLNLIFVCDLGGPTPDHCSALAHSITNIVSAISFDSPYVFVEKFVPQRNDISELMTN